MRGILILSFVVSAFSFTPDNEDIRLSANDIKVSLESELLVVRHSARLDRDYFIPGPENEKDRELIKQLDIINHWNQEDFDNQYSKTEVDPRLSNYGIVLARQIAQKLHKRVSGFAPSILYTSPFTRCVETAATFALTFGISDIRVVPGLGENVEAIRDKLYPKPVAEEQQDNDGEQTVDGETEDGARRMTDEERSNLDLPVQLPSLEDIEKTLLNTMDMIAFAQLRESADWAEYVNNFRSSITVKLRQPEEGEVTFELGEAILYPKLDFGQQDLVVKNLKDSIPQGSHAIVVTHNTQVDSQRTETQCDPMSKQCFKHYSGLGAGKEYQVDYFDQLWCNYVMMKKATPRSKWIASCWMDKLPYLNDGDVDTAELQRTYG